MTRAYLRRKLTGMAPVSLRRLALAGMVALGAACAETPEPETPDASIRGQYAKWRDQVLEWIDHNQALRTRANAGDTDAQYNLGFMYANGEGVPQDDAEVGLIRFRGHRPKGGYDGQNGIKAGRETSATTVL